MTSTSILQHQKSQINAVRNLIEKTRIEEAALNEQVSKEIKVSKLKREVEIQRCGELAEAKKNTIQQTFERLSVEVEKRRKLEPQILKERHDKRLSEIEEDAEDLQEDTESKLNEAIWLAESIYEAAILKPREEQEAVEEDLNKQLSKLDALCEKASKMRLSKRRRHDDSKSEAFNVFSTEPMWKHVEAASKALDSIIHDKRAKLFRGGRDHLFVGLITTAVAVPIWLSEPNFSWFTLGILLLTLVISIIILLFIYLSGKNSVRMKMQNFRSNVSAANRVLEYELNKADRERRQRENFLKETRERELASADEMYGPRLKEIERLFKKDLSKEKKRFDVVAEKLTTKLNEDSQNIQDTYQRELDKLEETHRNSILRAENEYETQLLAIETNRTSTINTLHETWKSTFQSFTTDLEEQRKLAENVSTSWEDTAWASWTPPKDPLDRIPLGYCTADLTSIGGELPKDSDLQLIGPTTQTLPLCLTLPKDSSLLISSSGKLRKQAIEVLQNAVIRVLTAIPPGKVKFTLIDPVGLGETYAGILHLADYEESQLLDRAWTEVRHIDQQLSDLTQHMETVIQKYLRNEFESIDDYNLQAGEIAEPYRFLVIADFPVNLSENSAKRLSSIITSGAKCGVHVIMHRDVGHVLPQGIDEDTLRRFSMTLVEHNGKLCIDVEGMRDLPLYLTSPPNDITTTKIVKTVGELAETTHRVEVPFRIIAPKEGDYWSQSSSHKLSVALGRAGATKLQNLVLGRGTAQHVLIAGKTGSGKSTLLHVLITNLALWYSPDEVEFYLVDFKKGVEFKTYATHKLPHARVIAVESDREFGLSVLQKVDRELKQRGELFRKFGVQDIAGFRKASKDPMPRLLLIVDEFQEFFVDDDKLAQEASLFLDRIVRQGRAFGVHAILGSQTLDGAYTLGRSTMGQMAVRIALQCSEADSYIILNEDNAAARLLSRPGEAIYNDSAGKVEGNSPFQIVWLDEEIRETQLAKVKKLYKGIERDMVVYEGNTPVSLEDNKAFVKAKASTIDVPPLASSAWLGAAMAIKEDTAAVFRQATANNLLIVGQQEEVTTSLVASTILSLDAQFPSDQLQLTVLDGTHSDATYATLLPEIIKHIDCRATLVGNREVEQAMQEIGEELQTRISDGTQGKPTQFLVVNGLQRFRDLRRNEDDFGFSMGDEEKTRTPSQIFAELIKEGPSLGMHVIVATDTLTNLNRSVDRQGLREFDLRVLLQMGNNDSSNLIDSTAASKLGMHRALLYSEEAGTIEPFRPYSIPVVADLVAASK